MKYEPSSLPPWSQDKEVLGVSKPIPPECLIEMGRAAYGDDWQSPLARALNIDEKSLRDWAKNGAPAWVCGQLRGYLNWRAQEISEALKFFEPWKSD